MPADISKMTQDGLLHLRVTNGIGRIVLGEDLKEWARRALEGGNQVSDGRTKAPRYAILDLNELATGRLLDLVDLVSSVLRKRWTRGAPASRRAG